MPGTAAARLILQQAIREKRRDLAARVGLGIILVSCLRQTWPDSQIRFLLGGPPAGGEPNAPGLRWRSVAHESRAPRLSGPYSPILIRATTPCRGVPRTPPERQPAPAAGLPTASAAILVYSKPEARTQPMTGTYTDDALRNLAQLPKRVTNPGARWSEKPTRHPVHRQRIFQAKGTTADGREHRFLVYQRQSLRDEPSYSCGIVYLPPGGPKLTLVRYNGPSHLHGGIRYKPPHSSRYRGRHPRRAKARA